MLYTVTGVRTVDRMTGSENEVEDEIVESYDVRLADFDRSPINPAGLLIGQVTETQIHSETKQVMSTGIVDGNEK
jgi:hypothetical protein